MTSRPLLFALIVIVPILFFVLIRWIVRLPQKYERKPRALSPWNALDNGIDPSDSEKNSS